MCGCSFGLEGMVAVGPMKPCGHYDWIWPEEIARREDSPSGLVALLVGFFIGLLTGIFIGLVILHVM